MLGPSTSQQKMASEKRIGRQVSGAGLMARGKISPQAKVWWTDWNRLDDGLDHQILP